MMGATFGIVQRGQFIWQEKSSDPAVPVNRAATFCQQDCQEHERQDEEE
jgi:hypothetical protein